MTSGLAKVIREASQRSQHALALQGLEQYICDACEGRGYLNHDEPNYQLEYIRCNVCHSLGMLKRPCTNATRKAALRKEIKRLQRELKKLEVTKP